MLTFDKTSRFTLPLLLAVALASALPACSRNVDSIVLEQDDLRIVFSDKEPGALKIALEAFRKDFVSVMGSEPVIVNEMDADTSTPEIVIVNREVVIIIISVLRFDYNVSFIEIIFWNKHSKTISG